MKNFKFNRLILIISILTVGLLVLTSCGDLITKVEQEDPEVEETTVVEEEPEEKEEESEEEPKVSELEGDRYAIVIDTDLSRVDENLQKPQDFQKGGVVYIHRIENGLAFVDVIGGVGEAIIDSRDYDPYRGYIPAENLILNPTEEDYEDKSITFHIKPGKINAKETVTNNEIEIFGDGYTIALEIEDDQILIPQAGGAHSVWISKDDVDYDFSGFTGY